MEHRYIKVAVIGRPNVGKSTLFNRLVKERKSIVDDFPGVTRDRLYAEIDWNNKPITLIDTGGLIEGAESSKDDFIGEIRKQAYSAIEEAGFIIFLVDGKSGITAQDEKIASGLRKIKDKKKIFLAVNKVDTEKQMSFIHEFYSLGLGEPYPISALLGSSGLADILDEITTSIKQTEGTENNVQGEIINVAIVGKPNVGKSSLLNGLVGKERSIVTSIAGTTRDSVDTSINIDGQDFVLIDTAGLRKKSKVSSVIERYATTRAISAIEKADVVLFVVDAASEISDQDQKIAALVKKRCKASIIIVNKWDLVENKNSTTINRFEENILSRLHFINYSKMLFTVATEKKNINKVWALINEVYANYKKRVSTGSLNKTIEDISLLISPPSKKGKILKIYYVTQANIKPPEIVFFVNDSELATEQFQKFLEREIRGKFDFIGSPLKLVFRNKRK
ncbi:MAG: ribosome biogenesis GTPase Der [Candidatus Melainabacteria bacterium]|nr:ribosome biogenesis GTPase Der [Candidatus Melainabacteria bacterium]